MSFPSGSLFCVYVTFVKLFPSTKPLPTRLNIWPRTFGKLLHLHSFFNGHRVRRPKTNNNKLLARKIIVIIVLFNAVCACCLLLLDIFFTIIIVVHMILLCIVLINFACNLYSRRRIYRFVQFGCCMGAILFIIICKISVL